ncbi:MAG: hypothetical protein QXZ70_09200 [Candidatus Bathyarchaeia archaeon]
MGGINGKRGDSLLANRRFRRIMGKTKTGKNPDGRRRINLPYNSGLVPPVIVPVS